MKPKRNKDTMTGIKNSPYVKAENFFLVQCERYNIYFNDHKINYSIPSEKLSIK